MCLEHYNSCSKSTVVIWMLWGFSRGAKGALCPLEMILPPELGLNDKLSLSQQLHSTVSLGLLPLYSENLDFKLFSSKSLGS